MLRELLTSISEANVIHRKVGYTGTRFDFGVFTEHYPEIRIVQCDRESVLGDADIFTRRRAGVSVVAFRGFNDRSQNRFCIAHGLGHVLLEAAPSTVCWIPDRRPLGPISLQEVIADMFAASLLAPIWAVADLLAELRPMSGEAVAVISHHFGIDEVLARSRIHMVWSVVPGFLRVFKNTTSSSISAFGPLT